MVEEEERESRITPKTREYGVDSAGTHGINSRGDAYTTKIVQFLRPDFAPTLMHSVAQEAALDRLPKFGSGASASY